MADCAEVPGLPPAKNIKQPLTGQAVSTADIGDAQLVDYSEAQSIKNTLNQIMASINTMPAFVPTWELAPVLTSIVDAIKAVDSNLGLILHNPGPGSPAPVTPSAANAANAVAISSAESAIAGWDNTHAEATILPQFANDLKTNLKSVAKATKNTLVGTKQVIDQLDADIQAAQGQSPAELVPELECAKAQAEQVGSNTIAGFKLMASTFSAANNISSLGASGNVPDISGMPDNIDAAISFLDTVIGSL